MSQVTKHIAAFVAIPIHIANIMCSLFIQSYENYLNPTKIVSLKIKILTSIR